MPYTEEELLNKLDALPEDIKDAIFDVQTSELLVEIGKKYTLHVDKVGELVNETGLVMAGITHPRDYVANLEKRLGVDRMTARKIAEEVNEQIFKKVRESLKKIHGITEEVAPLKPIEVRPTPAPILPAGMATAEEVPPGFAFEEKTKEAVFRTPPEVREMKVEGGKPEGGISELAEALKKPAQSPKGLEAGGEEKPAPKVDPYREPIE